MEAKVDPPRSAYLSLPREGRNYLSPSPTGPVIPSYTVSNWRKHSSLLPTGESLIVLEELRTLLLFDP